jgi:hypothetical protein
MGGLADGAPESRSAWGPPIGIPSGLLTLLLVGGRQTAILWCGWPQPSTDSRWAVAEALGFVESPRASGFDFAKTQGVGQYG